MKLRVCKECGCKASNNLYVTSDSKTYIACTGCPNRTNAYATLKEAGIAWNKNQEKLITISEEALRIVKHITESRIYISGNGMFYAIPKSLILKLEKILEQEPLPLPQPVRST